MFNNPFVMKDGDHLAIWTYLMGNATFQDYDVLFKGERITLKPGQMLSTIRKIGNRLKINESKVRRVLSTFEENDMLTHEGTRQNTLFTIKNWDLYQGSDAQVTHKVTHDRRTETPEETTENNNVDKKVTHKTTQYNKNVYNKNKEINTVENKFQHSFDKSKKRGPQSMKDLMSNYSVESLKNQKPTKGIYSRWQEVGLKWCEKYKIVGKDRARIMKMFKQNLSMMEGIFGYMNESSTPIKNPIAYVFYEYKRRREQNKKN